MPSSALKKKLTARPRSGLTLQSGLNTANTHSDSCALRTLLPETTPLNPYCDNSTGWIFFFNATATTDIYTLSLHDALPISRRYATATSSNARALCGHPSSSARPTAARSEEHTSELQSHLNLVCRLLLEKKKKKKNKKNKKIKKKKNK